MNKLYNQIKNKFFEEGFVATNTGALSPKELAEIAESFGDCMVAGPKLTTGVHTLEDRRIQRIAFDGLFGGIEVDWHCDASHHPGKFDGAMLYNQQDGYLSDTGFVYGVDIYNSFTKSEIDNLREVVCLYAPSTAHLVTHHRMERPLVTTHPLTKKESIYYSPATFQGSNVPFDTDDMYRRLDEFSFNHIWQPNDLIFWDNLQVMHRRWAYEGSRIMYRIQFEYLRCSP